MVILCNLPFEENDKYKQYFDMYKNFTLSIFQQWAIKAIVEEQHILITAATGSGKTLPAEFAIQFFVSKGKKVIYTTPIKALSNTKLSDLRAKYPNISFGIITGDITDNPEADVLIMTTEILTNTLFNKEIKKKSNNTNISLSFDIDIDNELAAVVFDEVHYINDQDRGNVWEQAIIKLPPQIQLIMLSATIDRPEDFAKWIELAKSQQSIAENTTPKTVYLAPSSYRAVPLTHYLWTTCHKSTIKNAKGTEYESVLNKVINKPILINDPNGVFNMNNAHQSNSISKYFKKHRHFVKRQFVLDTLIRYLKKNNGLPAICFVFSRKHVELAAKEICFSVLEDESNIPIIIEKECRNILARKLPNYQEYLELPEYIELLELLKKGIAIHHAGILTVFREMVEILFEKKYIRLLFATETLAVGINFSTTSVIFTGIEKYNGTTMRLLYPHEYTQMAGRAGRRGIDKIGQVWLCANLFHNIEPMELKHMITGPPQTLVSKFKISFSLCLNIIANDGNITNFASQSLMISDINNQILTYTQEITKLEESILEKEQDIKFTRTPNEVVKNYMEQQTLLLSSTNKQRKRIQRDLSSKEVEHKYIKQDVTKFAAMEEIKTQITTQSNYKQNVENHIPYIVEKTINLLTKRNFVSLEDTMLHVTDLGKIASQFKEVHPLMMARIIKDTKYLDNYSPEELAAFFSCFSNINVSDDVKAHVPVSTSEKLNNLTNEMNRLLNEYYDLELASDINTGSNYNRNYDIQQTVMNWCSASDEHLCKGVINDMKQDVGIFVGDFIKALLKINNIATEVERAAELMQNLGLIEKMRQIPALTLKYIATNQSLYV